MYHTVYIGHVADKSPTKQLIDYCIFISYSILTNRIFGLPPTISKTNKNDDYKNCYSHLTRIWMYSVRTGDEAMTKNVYIHAYMPAPMLDFSTYVVYIILIEFIVIFH